MFAKWEVKVSESHISWSLEMWNCLLLRLRSA